MKTLSRRAVLRGAGAAIALPLLDAMVPPRSASAAERPNAARPPVRAAFLFVPNGKVMNRWTPTAEGEDFPLSPILEPLAPLKSKINVLSGLSQGAGDGLPGEGAGDHARACAAFLTGAHARRGNGAEVFAGVSIDQAIAEKVGDATPFPTLDLTCEQWGNGFHDSGYSNVYLNHVSWRSATSPSLSEINPAAVFDRLFGTTPEQAKGRRSILDFVATSAAQLRTKLGTADRRKLDEYMTDVRDVERRMAHPRPAIDVPPSARPGPYSPDRYEEHVRMMCDLIALAFRTDMTRIVTFALSVEQSNRTYAELGAPEGHHLLSHHGNAKDKLAKLERINRFHVTQLGYLLERLQGIDEAGASLLDHSLVFYGSSVSDGMVHDHHDLPVLVAGSGGGAIRTGRHVRYSRGTPLTNLFLTVGDAMGATLEKLGDSTGRLKDLA